jgi:hypothetical protein
MKQTHFQACKFGSRDTFALCTNQINMQAKFAQTAAALRVPYFVCKLRQKVRAQAMT